MAKNQHKTKSNNKNTLPRPSKNEAGQVPTPNSVNVFVRPNDGSGREFGAFYGDAAVVQNLPAADRAELARHLVAVAGNLLSTVGDPIAGATIVVLTRRADG